MEECCDSTIFYNQFNDNKQLIQSKFDLVFSVLVATSQAVVDLKSNTSKYVQEDFLSCELSCRLNLKNIEEGYYATIYNGNKSNSYYNRTLYDRYLDIISYSDFM